ncbi:GyrI-like domain-containing protein [Luteimicrobium subarcticum]|uniref:GyrI-like small molecule binding protein n=1 Tax=Luteimicrobium subarcticum TaxID=620910 RepID=A0A2M8W6R8_9MICO|nr:GyrI-like domain-containing protein [Luteimicrobium subarcticum]PJI86623.1 GyrI-like small molecule binding protein [Luteimicrobium subarcticum]
MSTYSTAGAPPGTYRVDERAALPYVYLSRTVPMAGLNELAHEMGRVVGDALDAGLALAGPPLLRYRVIDMERALVVEAGVPVLGPDPGTGSLSAPDGLELGEIPAGRYLTVVHVGHPDSLEAATGAFLGYAASQGLTFDAAPGDDGEVWGSRIEWYLTDPRDEPDMDRWETELAFRLAD